MFGRAGTLLAAGWMALAGCPADRGGPAARNGNTPAPSGQPAGPGRPLGLPSGLVVAAALGDPDIPYGTWWIDLQQPGAPARVAFAPVAVSFDGRHLREARVVRASGGPSEPVRLEVRDLLAGNGSTLYTSPPGPCPLAECGPDSPGVEVLGMAGEAVSAVVCEERDAPRCEARTWLGSQAASARELLQPGSGDEVWRTLSRAGGPVGNTGDGPVGMRPRRNDLEAVVVVPGDAERAPSLAAATLPLRAAAGLGPLSFRLPGPPPRPALGSEDYYHHAGPGDGFLAWLQAGTLRLVEPERETRVLARGVRRVIALDWVKGRPAAAVEAALAQRFAPVGELRATVGPPLRVDGTDEEWKGGAQPYIVGDRANVLSGVEAWAGPQDLSFGLRCRVASAHLGCVLDVRNEPGTGDGASASSATLVVGTPSGLGRVHLALAEGVVQPVAASPDAASGRLARSLQGVVRRVPDGHRLEWALPLDDVQVADGLLPFAVQVNDHDRGDPYSGTVLGTAPARGRSDVGVLRMPGS